MPVAKTRGGQQCGIAGDGAGGAWIAAIKSSIDAMVASSVVDSWTWIDALQMSMPIFARLGGLYDDSSAEPCDPDGDRGMGYDVIPNFDDYGVGCFLLAGSEVAKLAQR